MGTNRSWVVWIVGSAYAILGSGFAVALLSRDHHWQASIPLGGTLAVATGALVHRSRPVLGAGLLMAGAFVIGLVAGSWVIATRVDWFTSSSGALIFYWLVVTLIASGPALLTGSALIRGRKGPDLTGWR